MIPITICIDSPHKSSDSKKQSRLDYWLTCVCDIAWQQLSDLPDIAIRVDFVLEQQRTDNINFRLQEHTNHMQDRVDVKTIPEIKCNIISWSGITGSSAEFTYPVHPITTRPVDKIVDLSYVCTK